MTIPQHAPADPHLTPAAVRQLCRENRFYSGGTPGYAPGYAQANVIILPAQYAEDFRLLCQRNPVPCPLLGWTEVGDPTVPKFLAVGSDIRTDCAKYNLYENGKLVDVKKDISDEWKEDSVAFFIGCSYSFEDAMVKAGLGLRHVETSRILPVYKTTVPLMPAGGKLSSVNPADGSLQRANGSLDASLSAHGYTPHSAYLPSVHTRPWRAGGMGCRWGQGAGYRRCRGSESDLGRPCRL